MAVFSNPNGFKPIGHNEEWDRLTPDDTSRYFKINLPRSVMAENIHQGRPRKWQQVIQEDRNMTELSRSY